MLRWSTNLHWHGQIWGKQPLSIPSSSKFVHKFVRQFDFIIIESFKIWLQQIVMNDDKCAHQAYDTYVYSYMSIYGKREPKSRT